MLVLRGVSNNYRMFLLPLHFDVAECSSSSSSCFASYAILIRYSHTSLLLASKSFYECMSKKKNVAQTLITRILCKERQSSVLKLS